MESIIKVKAGFLNTGKGQAESPLKQLLLLRTAHLRRTVAGSVQALLAIAGLTGSFDRIDDGKLWVTNVGQGKFFAYWHGVISKDTQDVYKQSFTNQS
jgi:hypothetical protein